MVGTLFSYLSLDICTKIFVVISCSSWKHVDETEVANNMIISQTSVSLLTITFQTNKPIKIITGLFGDHHVYIYIYRYFYKSELCM